MRAVVLAGMSRRVLDELMHDPYRTVELRGAKNVVAIEKAVGEAEYLFLTYTARSDVRCGTGGLIAEVLNAVELETHVPWEESDEREVTVCRVKLHLRGLGRVVDVREEGGVIVVDVRELMPHEVGIG